MRGYLNSKNNFKKTFNYETKDIGFFSSDKNLFVTGRLDNIFKSGNEKVSPEEIEDKIRPFLGKRSYIVVKKRHPILNWKPILIVEGKKIKSDSKLIENFEKKLSNFKLPSEIYYIKSFFWNNYGKIDRKKIFNFITNHVN
jgi:acyl-CoA synthetase (AMP-forming)/AMP-acid ligase II